MTSSPAALCNGGIPLVPESLRFSAVFEDMHPCDVVFYSASDVVTPQAMIEEAHALFDADGQMGILRRHQYGMGRHHGEQHLCRMLDVARELVGFTGP